MATHSLQHHADANPLWGVRFLGRESEQTKAFVASWIAGMKNNAEFAQRMRSDKLSEADLFETKRQCRNLIALRYHKLEFYLSSK